MIPQGMRTYLLYIGGVNALGVALLLGAMSDAFADKLLRRWTAILPPDKPFVHSAYSRIWLWWAVIGTGFYVLINFVAYSWPIEYVRWIVIGNCYAYFSFEALAIAATLRARHRYGKGLTVVSHFLWIAQGGWGVVTLL